MQGPFVLEKQTWMNSPWDQPISPATMGMSSILGSELMGKTSHLEGPLEDQQPLLQQVLPLLQRARIQGDQSVNPPPLVASLELSPPMAVVPVGVSWPLLLHWIKQDP